MSIHEMMLIATAPGQPAVPAQNDQTSATSDLDRQLRVVVGAPIGAGLAPTTNRAKNASFQAQPAGTGRPMRYWYACETAGAAAEFRLYLGTSALADGAHELGHVKLAAGQSAREALAVDASTGIYCEVVAGTIDLTIIP